MGKLIAEAAEAVDPGPLEAMRSIGASPWQVFLYGALPQVLPIYLSYVPLLLGSQHSTSSHSRLRRCRRSRVYAVLVYQRV